MPKAESPRQVDEGTQPSDPLLKSGCFIYPSESCDTETPVPGTPNYPRDSSSIGADVAVDSVYSRVTDSNGTEVPEATVDKYYCDPVSQHVFRSKNEVLHFVQTGTMLKRKKNTYVPDCEASENQCILDSYMFLFFVWYVSPWISVIKEYWVLQDIDNSGGRKQKKVAARLLPPMLDFDNVPTVTWVLKDSSKDLWVPHMDDHEVPNSVQQLWSAAFSWITSKFQ